MSLSTEEYIEKMKADYAALEQENAALKARLERLSAPVSDETQVKEETQMDSVLKIPRRIRNHAFVLPTESGAVRDACAYGNCNQPQLMHEWTVNATSANPHVAVDDISTEKIHILIERGSDGWWVAENQEISGCVSQGRTPVSALRNLADAMTAIKQALIDARVSSSSDVKGGNDGK